MRKNKAPDVQCETAPSGKNQKKYVRYSPLSLVLLGACVFVFAFSLLGMLEQTLLDTTGQAEINKLVGEAFPPLSDGGGGDVLVPSPDGDLGKWQQIAPEEIDTTELPYLFSPRFDFLKEQNEDTVAWMYWPTTSEVKGLPFNLPVVQSADNDFYLNKSFDRSYSVNGWVYADYRCDMDNLRSNRNTIIYAHARSYLMFGGLRFLNTKTQWLEDGYNHFIYINTPTERTVWQVFAWYETTTEFNYIDTYFENDQEYVAFLNTIQSKNTVDAFKSFTFTAEDRILTLSTCKGVNSDARVAMHAVLVKYESEIRGEEILRDPWSDVPSDPSGGASSEATDDAVTDPEYRPDFSGSQDTDSTADSVPDPATDSTINGDGLTTDTGNPTDSESSSDGGEDATDEGGESDVSDTDTSDSSATDGGDGTPEDSSDATDSESDASQDPTDSESDVPQGPSDAESDIPQDPSPSESDASGSGNTSSDGGTPPDAPVEPGGP